MSLGFGLAWGTPCPMYNPVLVISDQNWVLQACNLNFYNLITSLQYLVCTLKVRKLETYRSLLLFELLQFLECFHSSAL